MSPSERYAVVPDERVSLLSKISSSKLRIALIFHNMGNYRGMLNDHKIAVVV